VIAADPSRIGGSSSVIVADPADIAGVSGLIAGDLTWIADVSGLIASDLDDIARRSARRTSFSGQRDHGPAEIRLRRRGPPPLKVFIAFDDRVESGASSLSAELRVLDPLSHVQ